MSRLLEKIAGFGGRTRVHLGAILREVSIGHLVILALISLLTLLLIDPVLPALAALVFALSLCVLIFALVKGQPIRLWSSTTAVALVLVLLSSGVHGTFTAERPERLPSESESSTGTVGGIIGGATEGKSLPPISREATPEAFQTSWNAAATEAEEDLELPPVEIHSGEEQDTFEHLFSEDLGLLAAVERDRGTVSGVTIVGTPSEAIGATEMLISWGVLVWTLHPDFTAAERGEVLDNLGVTERGVDLYQLGATTSRDGVEYSVTGSEEHGVFFHANIESP